MLFRQQTFILITLAIWAFLVSHQESGCVIAAQNDKEDKEDKDDEIEEPVEVEFEEETGTVEEMMEDDELPLADDGNATEIPEEIEDIDCTCDGDTISCSNPSDYTACECDDGDVICMDEMISDAPMAVPAEPEPVGAPIAVMIDEPPAPDMQMSDIISSATSSPTVVSMAISAAGIAAAALN